MYDWNCSKYDWMWWWWWWWIKCDGIMTVWTVSCLRVNKKLTTFLFTKPDGDVWFTINSLFPIHLLTKYMMAKDCFWTLNKVHLAPAGHNCLVNVDPLVRLMDIWQLLTFEKADPYWGEMTTFYRWDGADQYCTVAARWQLIVDWTDQYCTAGAVAGVIFSIYQEDSNPRCRSHLNRKLLLTGYWLIATG